MWSRSAKSAWPPCSAPCASSTGFNRDNGPYDDHDISIVSVLGEIVLWKIDYYDLNRRGSSPDQREDVGDQLGVGQ